MDRVAFSLAKALSFVWLRREKAAQQAILPGKPKEAGSKS